MSRRLLLVGLGVAVLAVAGIAFVATSANDDAGPVEAEVCDQRDEFERLNEENDDGEVTDESIDAAEKAYRRLRTSVDRAAESELPAFQVLALTDFDEDGFRQFDAVCTLYDVWARTDEDRSVPSETVDVVVDDGLMAAAADRAANVRTGRFEFWESQSGGFAHNAGRGAFDSNLGAIAYTESIAFTGEPSDPETPPGPMPFATPTEYVITGNSVYMRGGLTPGVLDIVAPDEFAAAPGKQWIRIDLARLGAGTTIEDILSTASSASTGPAAMLASLPGTPEDLGMDRVRGHDSRHMRTALSFAEVAAAVESSPLADIAPASDELLDRLGKAANEPAVHVDIWLGRDGLVRRALTSIDGTVLADGLVPDDAGAGNDGPFTAGMIESLLGSLASSSSFYEYFDYGADVDIMIPTDAIDVTDQVAALKAAGAEDDGG